VNKKIKLAENVYIEPYDNCTSFIIESYEHPSASHGISNKKLSEAIQTQLKLLKQLSEEEYKILLAKIGNGLW
jgi:hypothetical protein